MKQMTTWQRLNAGTAVIILLLLVGLGLAFWMEKASSFASVRKGALGEFSQRVKSDLARMNLAVFALSFDPKDSVETNRYGESRKDFLAACGTVTKEFYDTQNLKDAVNDLRNFYEKLPMNPQTLETFYDDVLTMAAVNTNNAFRYYFANAKSFQSRTDDLLKNLDTQVEDVIQTDLNRAQRIATLGLISIVLILVSCAIVGRFQSRTVSKPLRQLVESLDRMRGGDFTQRLEINRQDEFGVIGEGLDRLADDLSMLVGRVQRSGIQVNMTATEIAATAKEQQSTANEIAATTAQIGATSKQISATSKELVKTMNEVSDVAQETAQLANTGQSGIGRMESTMRRIIEASGVITAKLAVMNEKTGNINSVVTTITKVADQTNLLSLNAAIEAEKAGEYGLGFAVVAMEIRRLADQTAVSTYDIEKMVKEMQSAAAAGVMGMDKFSEEVRRGVEEIRQVSAQLAAIINQVQTLTPRFQTVNEGMHTQSTGATQISETLGQLSEAAQQTAESLRQSNLAIEQLNEAAHGLQTSIAKFKLEG